MTTSKDANMPYPEISSLFPRTAHTLRLQMAMEAAHRADVGQRIKDLRGHLPQPALAEKLGVSLRAVQKWEAGESAPQWDNLVRLSKLFNVTQNFLLYGEREQATGELGQLDRIEAKLDELLSRLPAEGFDEVLGAEARRLAEQRAQRDAKSQRKPPRRKAS